MLFDIHSWRADVAALACECRALKTLLSTTWTRPMADEQRKLARLRWRVTELCVLRAWSRGHAHVTKAPAGIAEWDSAAWHSKIAERVAKDYPLATVPAITEGGAR